MAQSTLRDYLQSTEDAISSGRITDAFVACEHMLALYPDALEARRMLGEVHLAQGHLDSARQAFDWVLINDPENVIAYCDRALISERQADYDTALDCYQQAYELSRGNTQIRQEFNQLSQKIGQQGFIFSRAGLARLYMRGDLLPEAVQEWETVLTNAPDRLDARIGLLEACWREGLYGRVEQLAMQTLADVPGCLKALLLLAHVIHAQDVQQSRELLLRAEGLDPEWIMAQELFSDYLASHADEPFVMELQQKLAAHPSMFQPTAPATVGQPARAGNGATTTSSPGFSAFPGEMEEWSYAGSFAGDEQAQQQPEGASAANGASSFAPAASNNQIDRAIGQQTPQAEALASQQEPAGQATTVPISEQATMAQPLWLGEASDMERGETWSSPDDAHSSDSAAPWEMETQAQPLPKPPAWLEMLTRAGKPQAVEPEANMNPPAAAPETQIPSQPVQYSAEPEAEARPSSPPDIATTQEEEPLFFGPDWLKSLGAMTLEPPAEEIIEPPSTQEPVAVTQEEPQALAGEEAPAFAYETPKLTMVEASAAHYAAFIDRAATEPGTTQASHPLSLPDIVPPDEQAAPSQFEAEQEETAQMAVPAVTEPAWETTSGEQTLSTPVELDYAQIGTIEALENDLRAQGFIPVDLNSFSAIAQEAAQSEHVELQLETEVGPNPLAQQPEEMLAAQEADADAFMEQSSPFALWTSQVSTFTEFEEQEPVSVAAEEPTPPAGPTEEAVQEAKPASIAPPATVMPPPAPATEPEPIVASTPAPTIAEQSRRREDIALETTMKRPLAGLHAVQPTERAQHFNQRGADAGRVGKTSVHYRGQLLKGYQYQLAGLYDEAMQEYRVVIRGAPDLLGEVVSNMRALLKIAPKYVPGYRVLGDAYMRQGEFLQAMEAYNKALAMAKKGKN